MDETQTPPPEVSGEMQTESTIPASIADTTAPESQTTEPEVVPEPVQRPPLDVTLEPAQSIQGVPLDIVARGESADNALPVIQVEANSPGPTIEHSNILQNIGMLKGDENGSGVSVDSKGSPTFSVGGGAKPVGSISSYPTYTFVLPAVSLPKSK